VRSATIWGGGDDIEKRTTQLERTTARSMCHVTCAMCHVLFKKTEPNKKLAIY
jgi:hypothetical protein